MEALSQFFMSLKESINAIFQYTFQLSTSPLAVKIIIVVAGLVIAFVLGYFFWGLAGLLPWEIILSYTLYYFVHNKVMMVLLWISFIPWSIAICDTKKSMHIFESSPIEKFGFSFILLFHPLNIARNIRVIGMWILNYFLFLNVFMIFMLHGNPFDSVTGYEVAGTPSIIIIFLPLLVGLIFTYFQGITLSDKTHFTLERIIINSFFTNVDTVSKADKLSIILRIVCLIAYFIVTIKSGVYEGIVLMIILYFINIVYSLAYLSFLSHLKNSTE